MLRHPRANREAVLAGSVVAFEFKRGKRRTIGFMVGPDGLVVRAPQWVTLMQVDAALQEKSGWIIKKLGETSVRQQRVAAREIEWCDGTSIPFLGQPLTVQLDPLCVKTPRGVAAAVLVPGSTALQESTTQTLRLSLPPSATPEQIRNSVQAWLVRQAQQNFIERLHHFAPQLQVRWTKLSLSNARTRWGSARSDGSIRLNWRLMHQAQTVIDYVVAHELSHLREMNHSDRFWACVEEVFPGWREAEAWIKRNGGHTGL